MDLLNGQIIDGKLGIFRQSERELLKINLKNSKKFLDSQKSILTLDCGFISLENNGYFIVFQKINLFNF